MCRGDRLPQVEYETTPNDTLRLRAAAYLLRNNVTATVTGIRLKVEPKDFLLTLDVDVPAGWYARGPQSLSAEDAANGARKAD
jgi:hypothetical protein